MYCKIKSGEYKDWVGVVNSLVSETSAQGRVWSVSITNDFTKDGNQDNMTTVFLPETIISFINK